MSRTPRVSPYRAQDRTIVGWKLYGSTGRFIVLDPTELRTAADALHDLADRLDNERREQQNASHPAGITEKGDHDR